MIPYRFYREKLVTTSQTADYSDGFLPMRYMIGDCQICKTNDSMFVFDSFENVRRCINQCS